MQISAELTVSYDNSSTRITGSWKIRDDRQSRDVIFSFTTGLDFDTDGLYAEWEKPDGTRGSLDNGTKFEGLAPADRARAFLFGASAAQMIALRENIYQRRGDSRSFRERLLWEQFGGTEKVQFLPVEFEFELGKPEGAEAFQALFDEYPLSE